MKNKLAENILRFGAKNLKESDIKQIKALMQEQDTNATTTQQTGNFPTLESVWADPRLKSSEIMVTAGEQRNNPNITRETKYNNILWENLVKYYGAGTSILGKNAIGWKSPIDFSAQELLLEQAATNFKIADIFVGKDHTLTNAAYTEGQRDCIYICSEKMYVKPRKPEAPADGYVGNFYIEPGAWDETAMDIKTYYTRGIPRNLHLKIVAGKVYLATSYNGTYIQPKYELASPLSDIEIVNSIKQAF
jgi:hypothetical protein